MFQNRIEAGKKLAEELLEYKNQDNAVIVGLPRGGVPVAYQIAKRLCLPLDIVCPRKIGAPSNKEFAIGAITETGDNLLNEEVIDRLNIAEEYLKEEIKKETSKAKARLDLYREGKAERNFYGKIVILVDDGLATGSTMKAAIQSIKSGGAEKIVVAVPVSAPDTFYDIKFMVDQMVCLEVPLYFQAVGQFYIDFRPTEDEEVISLMKLARSK